MNFQRQTKNTPLKWEGAGEFIISSSEKFTRKFVFAKSGSMVSRSIVYIFNDSKNTFRIPIRKALVDALVNPPPPGQNVTLNCLPYTYMILPTGEGSIMILHGREGIWNNSGIILSTQEIWRIVLINKLWERFELDKPELRKIELWLQLILANSSIKDTDFFTKVEEKMALINKTLGTNFKVEPRYHPLFDSLYDNYSANDEGVIALKTLIQLDD